MLYSQFLQLFLSILPCDRIILSQNTNTTQVNTARRARVRTRAHIERLEAALHWALEHMQIDDKLDPDQHAALTDALELLED